MNILTFDIEEWFHILDNDGTKNHSDWIKFESRIHKNTDRILDFLIRNKVSATFFIVGWIAERYPEVVRKINSYGFEIGSHTHMHQLVYEQTPSVFKNDLIKSLDVLEGITGYKVRSFRAPGFSITEKNKWAFDILFECGITHDSSVFPAFRAHGGMPSYENLGPAFLKHNDTIIKEFPINTFSLFGKSIVFSGGGYFRLCPYSLIKYLSNSSQYMMTYFHPRDFDFSQPVLSGLSPLRKFKSYFGLKKSFIKLEKWINDFEFIDLRAADQRINWNNAKVINI